MRRLATLLAAASLALVACGGSGSSSTSTSPSATASGSAAAKVAVEDKGPFPDVSGKAGAKPTVAVSKERPSDKVERKVLQKGDGAVVKSGDLLVANYSGSLWADGKVFDNSYDRGSATPFPIGVGQVIPGWDSALVGQKVGSRVLLTIPPAAGYGAAGQTSGPVPIKGTDTLVFVVDIVKTFGPGAQTPKSTPVSPAPAGVPALTDNGAGKAPTVTVDGYTEPPASRTTLVAAGTGDDIGAAKTVIVRAAQVDAKTKEVQFENFGKAPVSTDITSFPGLAEALAGQKTGARVLVQITGADNKDQKTGAAGDPLVFVLDVVSAV